MKTNLCLSILVLFAVSVTAQHKHHKFGVTAGGSVQHYNGNLGNSFFKFNSVCYGGGTATLGIYLNKSLDLNVGAYLGFYGYHAPHEDGQEVPLEERCPGCYGVGMGNLSSFMVSGNLAIKYKLANDIILRENARFAPYVYGGVGINHLSDAMKKNCVNVGYHFTVNGGAGLKYNINERFNISYNLGLGCFVFEKVYNTNLESGLAADNIPNDVDYRNAQKRKDLYLQNTLALGINF
jgi:hypothetical protein